MGSPFRRARSIIGPLPAIDWPDWATKTVNIERRIDRRGFRHCRRARPRDHAGGFAAAVPLARRFHHHGAAGRERRGAARSGPQRHQVRHRRPLLRRGARSPRCSGSAAARGRRIRRSAARSRTTSTISGSSARPTRPWRWRRTALAEIGGGWVLVQRRQGAGRGALRDRRADDAASCRRTRCRDAGSSTRRRKRSNGCTSRPSRRAGIRAFPNGCNSRR